MTISQLRSNLKGYLTSVFNINKWDAIQHSMLPKDTPKGYFQLVDAKFGQVSDTIWLVGIGVASTTLDGLWSQVDTILDLIDANMIHPQPCLTFGSLKITSSIQVEIPDSYVNQGGISVTTGFRTAISFQVTIQSAR